MHVLRQCMQNKKGGHAHSQEMVLHSTWNLSVLGVVLDNTVDTPVISWYSISIVMPICSSSIKTRVVYYSCCIKRTHMTTTQSNEKSADVSAQHICNTNCIVTLNSEMYWSHVANTSTVPWYVAQILWYTNFPALAVGGALNVHETWPM